MSCTETEAHSTVDRWPCSEPSVEHVDGTVECLGTETCDLPHHLHDWVLSCDDLDPPCSCASPRAIPWAA
jgi:hypothetical protein